jgi:pimeloyl-ACP methyl ester carboxylesterase
VKIIGLLALFVASPFFLFPAEEQLIAKGARVDGLFINYYEAGEDPTFSRTILFVHGWGGSAADYLPTMRALAPEFRCIAVDLPGCGYSDKPDIHYTFPYLVDFLEKFTMAIGLKRFTLAGHSLGGQISVYFTREHPDQVENLILIAPDGFSGEEGGYAWLARLGPILDFVSGFSNRFFVEFFLRMNAFHDPKKMTEEYVESVVETYCFPPSRRTVVRMTQELIGSEPVNDVLPLMKGKVLLLWGADDNVLAPSWSTKFYDKLPYTELHLIPDCGHLPTVEQPELTAGFIRDYLD